MISLQKNRSRLVDFVIELAAGGLRALDIIMNFHPVQDHRDLVAHDRRLTGLPLISRAGNKLVRGFEVINCTVAAQRWLAAGVVAENLNLMPATKVKSAVRVVRHQV